MVRPTSIKDSAAVPRVSTLFVQISEHPDPIVPADAVVSWATDLGAAIDLVRPAGHAAALQWVLSRRDQRDPLQVMLGELAALSRVLQLLAAPLQPGDGPEHTGYDGPLPERSAYVRFAAAIGLTPIGEDAFHPFFHEIVAVEQADDPDEPITLLDEVWPGYLLGSLLMQRAGVRVRAGAGHAVAPVAASSRLHWAWWRRRRDTADSTDFRRDYRTDEGLYYNVDARPETLRASNGHGEPALSSCERLELLRHRCLLRRAEVAGTHWRWAQHLRYCEPLQAQRVVR
jgi:hypothetical protein